MNDDASDMLFKQLKSFGLSQGYASDLASGKRKPSLKLAVELERKLGISPSFWINRAAEAA